MTYGAETWAPAKENSSSRTNNDGKESVKHYKPGNKKKTSGKELE